MLPQMLAYHQEISSRGGIANSKLSSSGSSQLVLELPGRGCASGVIARGLQIRRARDRDNGRVKIKSAFERQLITLFYPRALIGTVVMEFILCHILSFWKAGWPFGSIELGVWICPQVFVAEPN